MNRMHVVIACISFIFMMLSQDGREVCAIHAKKCPQIPVGSRRMERRNGWVGSCSTHPLLCDSETLGLAESTGWTTALLPLCRGWLHGKRVMHPGWPGQALKGSIPSSCPSKGYLLSDAIFILNYGQRFFVVSPTSLWPWELRYSQHHNGRGACPSNQVSRTAVGKHKVFLADKLCELGKRGLPFFLLFLIQLLSDLPPLNKQTCPWFSQLWSWLVIAL